MEKDARKRGWGLRILANILLIIVIAGSIIVFYNRVIKKDISDLRYTIETTEQRRKVEVKEIFKEKGKEDKYRIEIFDGETEIPKSIYEKYIGDENNTITVQESEVHIYIGDTHLLPIPTSFSGDVSTVVESRFSYPWESKVKPYTKEEARALAMSYLKGDVSINGVSADPENLQEF